MQRYPGTARMQVALDQFRSPPSWTDSPTVALRRLADVVQRANAVVADLRALTEYTDRHSVLGPDIANALRVYLARAESGVRDLRAHEQTLADIPAQDWLTAPETLQEIVAVMEGMRSRVTESCAEISRQFWNGVEQAMDMMTLVHEDGGVGGVSSLMERMLISGGGAPSGGGPA